MKPYSLIIRPHPTKDKVLVTPVFTLKKLNELMQQKPTPIIQWPKKNISSGEDLLGETYGIQG